MPSSPVRSVHRRPVAVLWTWRSSSALRVVRGSVTAPSECRKPALTTTVGETIAERKLRRARVDRGRQCGDQREGFALSRPSGVERAGRWPLRASFADQHLHTHDQASVMLEWCKSRPYLLSYQAAVTFGEGEVHLWLRSSSCFDRVPVIVKTRNHVLAHFALYSDVLEARASEQGFQPLPV